MGNGDRESTDCVTNRDMGAREMVGHGSCNEKLVLGNSLLNVKETKVFVLIWWGCNP